MKRKNLGIPGGSAREEQELLVQRLRWRIEELEHIIEAFDRTGELARLERLEAERIIKAQENLQSFTEKERRDAEAVIAAQEKLHDLAEKERRDAEAVIAAQEKLHDLAEKERRDAEAVIAAQEKVHDLAEKERRDADAVIAAREKVQELADKERREADAIITARENVQELADTERREADAIIAAQEKVRELADTERMEAERITSIFASAASANRAEYESADRDCLDTEAAILEQRRLRILAKKEFARAEGPPAAVARVLLEDTEAMNEIKRRDAVLAAIVSMNSNMSLSQLVADLFMQTLGDALRLLNAQRGFIARYGGGNSMRIVVQKGYGSIYNEDAGHVLARLIAGEKVAGIHACLTIEGRICGIVYAERLPGKDALGAVESGFLDVLTSQLSVSFGYVLLRERFQQKNFVLQQTMKLRDKGIRYLSVGFQRPLEKIIELLKKEADEGKKEVLDNALQFKKRIDKFISIFSQQKKIDGMHSYSVQIDTIVRKIVSGFQKELENRKIEITCIFPEKVLPFSGDYDTVYTIIDEVICNAVVYNREGGRVQVEIEQEESICHVRVRDTGVGVERDTLPKIFERFYRAPGSGELHSRGAGLGLFIVREFIESYGGSVSFTSKKGKGSEVVLVFPMRQQI
jgi:anti-sigma regulatory factor (Ser/Thr protein kinase)